ncbi:hypothetical protein F8O01_11970 [Pseudoclavibacter chungangensis]|uniref:Uncharacterized protein n=1 Tax=Pseudoclavibacter chungangensis TaxID=587635 RepID=A0A7J5BPT4_9MICO|nr:hypothetical protein [Pseudoclavibacter chungangensis]KAB1655337.1 hypothetical protein F8O01_11970 [Pseudoclavibacter chungangensis]NYJ68285.1 hypothetical protein [Pseudoclavibacter chungangensis]
MTTAALSFDEYWRLYFPDLLSPLAEDDRRMIVELLASAYLDGELPGRETVQRVVEVERGDITEGQYRAWAIDVDGDGVELVIDRLRDREATESTRGRDLGILAGFDYSDAFAARVRAVGADGVLTADEVRDVLQTSLRNPPFPALRDRPADVPDLGFARVLLVGDRKDGTVPNIDPDDGAATDGPALPPGD